jgi:hypothetical protein
MSGGQRHQNDEVKIGIEPHRLDTSNHRSRVISPSKGNERLAQIPKCVRNHEKETLRRLTRADVVRDVANRWDEKAGLRRDAVGSQVIGVLEAQEIKETSNEEG